MTKILIHEALTRLVKGQDWRGQFHDIHVDDPSIEVIARKMQEIHKNINITPENIDLYCLIIQSIIKFKESLIDSSIPTQVILELNCPFSETQQTVLKLLAKKPVQFQNVDKNKLEFMFNALLANQCFDSNLLQNLTHVQLDPTVDLLFLTTKDKVHQLLTLLASITNVYEFKRYFCHTMELKTILFNPKQLCANIRASSIVAVAIISQKPTYLKLCCKNAGPRCLEFLELFYQFGGPKQDGDLVIADLLLEYPSLLQVSISFCQQYSLDIDKALFPAFVSQKIDISKSLQDNFNRDLVVSLPQFVLQYSNSQSFNDLFIERFDEQIAVHYQNLNISDHIQYLSVSNTLLSNAFSRKGNANEYYRISNLLNTMKSKLPSEISTFIQLSIFDQMKQERIPEQVISIIKQQKTDELKKLFAKKSLVELSYFELYAKSGTQIPTQVLDCIRKQANSVILGLDFIEITKQDISLTGITNIADQVIQYLDKFSNRSQIVPSYLTGNIQNLIIRNVNNAFMQSKEQICNYFILCCLIDYQQLRVMICQRLIECLSPNLSQNDQQLLERIKMDLQVGFSHCVSFPVITLGAKFHQLKSDAREMSMSVFLQKYNCLKECTEKIKDVIAISKQYDGQHD